MSTATEAAQSYARRGWAPIPVPFRSKNPNRHGWEKERLTEADINGQFKGKNVGVLMGEPSGGIVDVDLDCREAIQVAPRILPATGCIFGRKSKPDSHFIYAADPLVSTTKFHDVRDEEDPTTGDKKRATLVELRSTGSQTVFPPSTHEKNELIEFSAVDAPATIEGPFLLALVSKLAAAALLARHWPGKGTRHDAELALAGGLIRGGWAPEDVTEFIVTVAEAGGGLLNKESRLRVAEDTEKRIRTGDKATGWNTLREIIEPAAVAKVREWLGLSRNEVSIAGAQATGDILDKHDPLPTARKFIHEHFTDNGTPTLLHAGDVFFAWTPTAAYAEVESGSTRSLLYPFLEKHRRIVMKGKERHVLPFQPTKHDVDLTIDALKSESYTGLKPPAWLGTRGGDPDPAALIVARNGIVNLAEPTIIRAPTPRLFTLNALDYEFVPQAPEPAEWIKFLDTLWPGDNEPIELLQEWFGYCLTGDTRQQKILLLVGPPRSGKGTIARVLSRMLGLPNVCAPTLAGLGTNFGMWSLIGKLVGIISDARLSGRTDQAIVTERLLTISGEDAVTIDRKHLPSITLHLPTRLMILTNELPRLADSSGALAGRFLLLPLVKTFLGQEDTGLTDRLLAELPGILFWSVAGWQRLRGRGHFQQPAIAEDAINELRDLASPVAAFGREWCIVTPGACCPVKELYEAWSFWCREQGRDQPGDAARFGRDLRSAFPGVVTRQVRTKAPDDERIRKFEGINLTEKAKMSVSVVKAAAAAKNEGRR